MKHFYFLLFIFLFSSFTQIKDLNNYIVQGFKNNDSKNISKYFSSSINLSINREERIVSQFQGDLILADFFKSNKVKEIKQIASSGSDQSNRYAIYQLVTSNAKYRVVVKFIDLKGSKSISELRIE